MIITTASTGTEIILEALQEHETRQVCVRQLIQSGTRNDRGKKMLEHWEAKMVPENS